MAKVKYKGDDPRTDYGKVFGLVTPGRVVDVPDELVFGLTQQEDVWEAHDKAAKDAHAAGAKARDERVEAESRARLGYAELPELADDEGGE